MEFAAPVRKAPMAVMADSRGATGMELDTVAMDATKTTPWERRFNPYDFNGGECQDCLKDTYDENQIKHQIQLNLHLIT